MATTMDLTRRMMSFDSQLDVDALFKESKNARLSGKNNPLGFSGGLSLSPTSPLARSKSTAFAESSKPTTKPKLKSEGVFSRNTWASEGSNIKDTIISSLQKSFSALVSPQPTKDLRSARSLEVPSASKLGQLSRSRSAAADKDPFSVSTKNSAANDCHDDSPTSPSHVEFCDDRCPDAPIKTLQKASRIPADGSIAPRRLFFDDEAQSREHNEDLNLVTGPVDELFCESAMNELSPKHGATGQMETACPNAPIKARGTSSRFRHDDDDDDDDFVAPRQLFFDNGSADRRMGKAEIEVPDFSTLYEVGAAEEWCTTPRMETFVMSETKCPCAPIKLNRTRSRLEFGESFAPRCLFSA